MRTRACVSALLVAAMALVLGTAAPEAAARKKAKLEIARIYWEYNSTDNDLGVHVFLDGEDWKSMRIFRPDGDLLFEVEGKEGYEELGLTELFFEGAEPSLDDVPLEDLLDLFPEGTYAFEGSTVDGAEIEGEAFLSHAIPDGPAVHADDVSGSTLVIEWDAVGDNPEGFPDEAFTIVRYQVIVESGDGRKFEVTLPGDATHVTVPPEFVDSLKSGGEYDFEVLAISGNGNQSITAGTFSK